MGNQEIQAFVHSPSSYMHHHHHGLQHDNGVHNIAKGYHSNAISASPSSAFTISNPNIDLILQQEYQRQLQANGSMNGQQIELSPLMPTNGGYLMQHMNNLNLANSLSPSSQIMSRSGPRNTGSPMGVLMQKASSASKSKSKSKSKQSNNLLVPNGSGFGHLNNLLHSNQ